MDICEDRLRAFLSKYVVEEVKALISKSSITTGDTEVQVTLNRKKIQEIPNVVIYREKKKEYFARSGPETVFFGTVDLRPRSAQLKEFSLHLVQQRKQQQQ